MKTHLKILFLALLVTGAGWLMGCGGGSGIVVEQGGKKVRLRGTVRDAQGRPVANAATFTVHPPLTPPGQPL